MPARAAFTLAASLLPALALAADIGALPPKRLLTMASEQATKVDARADDAEEEGDPLEDGSLVVLANQIDVRILPDGDRESTLTRVWFFRDHDAIDQLGTLETSWAPWRSERPEMTARIIAPDGSESWLDPDDIQEAGSAGRDPLILSDDKRLRAPLPNLRPGSVVVWTEHRVDHPMLVPGSYSGELDLAVRAFTGDLRVTLSAPATAGLSATLEQLEGVEPEVRTKKGITTWTLHQQDVEPDDDHSVLHPAAPVPDARLAYHVGPGWDALARTYLAEVQPLLTADGLETWVSRIREAGPDRDAMVNEAMALLRENNRYTGIELGRQAIIPVSPLQTVKRGYGDCKDRAALLVSLLEAVGIEAHLALLRAGRDADIHPDHPGLDGFNHAIVHLAGEDGAPDRWIDATSDFHELGALPTGVQNRLALVVDDATTDVTRIPLEPASLSVQDTTFVYEVPQRGPAVITRTSTASGNYGADLRWGYDGVERAELRKWAKSMSERSFGVEDPEGRVTVSPTRDPRIPAEVVLYIGKSTVTTSDGVAVDVPVEPAAALRELPEWAWQEPSSDDPLEDEADEATVTFFPSDSSTTIEVRVPPALRSERVPEPIDEHFGPLHLTASGRWVEEGRWRQVSRLVMEGPSPTVGDLRKLRAFVKAGHLQDDHLTFAHPSVYPYRDDEWNDFWTAFQGGPRDARSGPWLDLFASVVFQDLGMFEERDRMRKVALAANPDDPAFLASWARTHLPGRTDWDRSEPEDRARAIEVWKQVVAGDPDDEQGGRADLAEYLRLEGRDASEETRVEYTRESLELATLLFDDLEDDSLAAKDLRSSLAPMHLALDDAQGALDLLEKNKDERDGNYLSAVAAVQGPKAAVERVHELTSGLPKTQRDQARDMLLIPTIVRLLTVRRYEEAREVAAALSPETTDNPDAAPLLRLVNHANRAEKGFKNAPEYLRPWLLALRPLALTGEPADERYLMDGAPLRTKQIEVARTQSNLSAEYSRVALLEILASTVQVEQVDGDPSRGLRVQLDILGNPGVLYLVRHRGHLVVVDNIFAGTGAALQGLREFESGRIDHARTWASYLRRDASQTSDFFRASIQTLLGTGPESEDELHASLAVLASSFDLDVWDDAVGRLDALSIDARPAALQFLGGSLGMYSEELSDKEITERRLVLARAALATELPSETTEAAHLLVASSLSELERPEEALAAYEACLEAFPNSVDARTGRIGMLAQLRRTDEARAGLEASWGESTDPSWLNNLGWHHLVAGLDPQFVVDKLEPTLRGELQYEDLYRLNTLAVAHALNGQLDKAAEDAARAAPYLDDSDGDRPAWALVHGTLAMSWGADEIAGRSFAKAREQGLEAEILIEKLKAVGKEAHEAAGE